MLLRFVLMLLNFIGTIAAWSQATESFMRYTTAEGLSGNYVTGLAQDATGYIWISTATGINRFNGSRFVQFHSNDNYRSPAAEEITSTVWLDESRLGFYSGAGLHIINTKNGESKNIFVPYKHQQYLYKFNTIHGAKADRKGNLYVLTRSGFYHFKNDSLVWRFDYYKENELTNTHFHFGGDLFEFDEKHLLIVSSAGLFMYEKEKRVLRKMQHEDSPTLARFTGLSNQYVLFLQRKPGEFFLVKPESDSALYLNVPRKQARISRLPFIPGRFEFHYRSRLSSASDTLLYLTGHTAGYYRLRLFTETGEIKLYPERQFPSYLCTTLLKDKEGVLWVGTNKGLFRQDTRQTAVQFTHLPKSVTDSFANVRVSDIHAVDDKVYVGTRGEAGLLVFDKRNLRYERQIMFDKVLRAFNQVSVLKKIGHSTLLLGTYNLLQLVDTRSGKTKPLLPPGWKVGADWTNDILLDDDGYVWISASSNTYKYHPPSNQFKQVPVPYSVLNLPVMMSKDRDGKIWMASHGMARYDETSKGFDEVLDSFPSIKMPDRQVSAPVFDADNNLWFSSNNNGLIGYNPIKKRFRHITTRNGLPDNSILALVNVDNKLWMAFYSGVACLDLHTGELRNFGAEDGFPNISPATGSRFFYDSSTAEIYLGFSSALVRFRPDALLQKKNPPKTFFESVVVDGQQTHYLPGNAMTASWLNKELRITVGSINFNDGNRQRYAYRVLDNEATETAWTDIGSDPSFSIAGLSPGKHRIQVKVSASDSRWRPQTTELLLTVLPPWWKELWFLSVVGVTALALLYFFIKWRIAIAQRKEMVKTQLEKLKADDYKAQFELEQISHFFSSSLAGKKTESEVLWDVARNLIGRLGYEDCIIYVWDENKTKMVQKAAFGPKGKPELVSVDGFTVAAGQGVVGHVIKTKEPVLVRDTRLDNRYRIDDKFRLSEVAVPILHSGELLGVIDSENSQLDYFTKRDIKVLTTIATLIGNKLVHLQSEQELEAKQLELASINEQLAEARLAALQAQMNPHFVFNALNSIKRMILDGDNDKASRYLSKFAQMIRMTLEHSKEVFVTLDENITYLKAYLDMERLRFDDGFSYTLTTDETIDRSETVLPSMMIQPLVENAIWHGLLQAEGSKHLRIEFGQEANRIACIVEDNGIGYRKAEQLRKQQRPLHRSVGLENLRKRIRIINEKYQTDARLEIIDLKESGINGHGTRVVLEMNILNT